VKFLSEIKRRFEQQEKWKQKTLNLLQKKYKNVIEKGLKVENVSEFWRLIFLIVVEI
jgi:hypothetical protein